MKGSPSHWYNHSLLLTSDSFICRQDNHGRIKPPTMISSLVTVFFYMVILSLIEQICIHLLASLKVRKSESFSLKYANIKNDF